MMKAEIDALKVVNKTYKIPIKIVYDPKSYNKNRYYVIIKRGKHYTFRGAVSALYSIKYNKARRK